jgi:hypothetical protein
LPKLRPLQQSQRAAPLAAATFFDKRVWDEAFGVDPSSVALQAQTALRWRTLASAPVTPSSKLAIAS